MSNPSEPTLTVLLKRAVDQGQVVLVSVPSPLLPPRTKAELAAVAICRQQLKLTPAEGRAFMKLVGQDNVTREELHAAICSDAQIKIVDVIISKLRKKLARHGIKIETLWATGYALHKTGRDKIRKIFVEYGEEIISAVTPPRPSLHERALRQQPTASPVE